MIPKIMSATTRDDTLEGLATEPYLGYESLEAASHDCKATSQVEILSRLLNRENIFISGPAGSGKSSLIGPVKRILEQENEGIQIALTAYTGLAANSINGVTLHSWSGFGSWRMYQPSPNNPLKLVDILVIDEVSMVPLHMFEDLDKAMKKVRGNDEPFGGVQLVLMGDFAQLPPVKDRDKDLDSRFCILSEAWKNADIKMCYMDKTHRARDPKLQKVLREISNGKVDDSTKALINSRMTPCDVDPEKTYVTLFTTNKKIDEYNQKKLDEVNSPSVFFPVRIDRISKVNVTQESIDKAINAFTRNGNLQTLELKVGCPVIVTKNIPYGGEVIPNGGVGTVVSLRNNLVQVKLNGGKTVNIAQINHSVEMQIERKLKNKTFKVTETVASVSYMPLRVGFATSVHRSQGLTYTGVVVDLSNAFMPNLGYVALSRVRSLDDLVITGLGSKALKMTDASLKISLGVKRSALKNRKEFLANQEYYDTLLVNKWARAMIWSDVDFSLEAKAMRGVKDFSSTQPF